MTFPSAGYMALIIENIVLKYVTKIFMPIQCSYENVCLKLTGFCPWTLKILKREDAQSLKH